jgi:hypothetical protein
MPCTEMMQLEAACGRLVERRRERVAPAAERRKMPTGWLQARAAYLMRIEGVAIYAAWGVRELITRKSRPGWHPHVAAIDV